LVEELFWLAPCVCHSLSLSPLLLLLPPPLLRFLRGKSTAAADVTCENFNTQPMEKAGSFGLTALFTLEVRAHVHALITLQSPCACAF